jgi:hypothetical protein
MNRHNEDHGISEQAIQETIEAQTAQRKKSKKKFKYTDAELREMALKALGVKNTATAAPAQQANAA